MEPLNHLFLKSHSKINAWCCLLDGHLGSLPHGFSLSTWSLIQSPSLSFILWQLSYKKAKLEAVKPCKSYARKSHLRFGHVLLASHKARQILMEGKSSLPLGRRRGKVTLQKST